MKAALLTKFKQIELKELEVPKLKEGEALIKVSYAGICGSDVHVFMGHHPTAKPPLVLGHEFCGTISDIKTEGKGYLKPGDKVVAQPVISCNACDMCVDGKENLCADLNIIGVHSDGCFAQYVKMPVRKIYKLPEFVDLRLAVLAEPLAVAVHDVRRSGLLAGQTVFIIGGGPIGMMIAFLSKLTGASKIVLSEPNESRAAFAEKQGFPVLNPTKSNIQAEAMKITDGAGFDKVFEVTGTSQGAALMTEITKKGGNIVLVGFPNDNYVINTSSIITKELRLDGVRIHAQMNFAAAIGILESGMLNEQLEALITNEFSLDDICAAMRFSMEEQNHLKVILKV